MHGLRRVDVSAYADVFKIIGESRYRNPSDSEDFTAKRFHPSVSEDFTCPAGQISLHY